MDGNIGVVTMSYGPARILLQCTIMDQPRITVMQR